MNRAIPIVTYLAAAVACGSARTAPPAAAQQLAAAKQQLMSADYGADLAALARWRDTVDHLTADPDLGYLAHYWVGFASWRIAINGANIKMSNQDLQSHLRAARGAFETSIRLKPDFADGYAAAALTVGWLIVFLANDRPAALAHFKESTRLLNRAKELAPNNPRVLWAEAAPLLFLPPERGGDVARAIDVYRRMAEASPRATDTSSPFPDWGKPEALMSLAFAHLQTKPPDVTAARAAANTALELQPTWSYVRGTLLPQIDAAERALRGAVE